MKYREPTNDECSERSRVVAYTADDGTKRMGYATWYPQMGGYIAKCVVLFDEPIVENECFDALIWHDGEFPLGRETEDNPRAIHHCAAEQFYAFAKRVEEMQAKHRVK